MNDMCAAVQGLVTWKYILCVLHNTTVAVYATAETLSHLVLCNMPL